MAMTAVFQRGIIPYHTHQELQPGVKQLWYKSSLNSTISTDQLSATIIGISMRIIKTSRDIPPSASFHCNGAPLMTSHNGIAMMALPQ